MKEKLDRGSKQGEWVKIYLWEQMTQPQSGPTPTFPKALPIRITLLWLVSFEFALFAFSLSYVISHVGYS